MLYETAARKSSLYNGSVVVLTVQCVLDKGLLRVIHCSDVISDVIVADVIQ